MFAAFFMCTSVVWQCHMLKTVGKKDVTCRYMYVCVCCGCVCIFIICVCVHVAVCVTVCPLYIRINGGRSGDEGREEWG